MQVADRYLALLPPPVGLSRIDIIVSFDDDQGMKYPGGKGKCYQRLINLMPPHQTYIESHLGAGAVMRFKKPAMRNIGIDIDPEVHVMWQQGGQTGLCELIEDDAVSVLSSFNYAGQELVYVDPPYLVSTRRRDKIYRFDYNQGQHERLLAVLLELPCMVMVSGYDSQLYDHLLKGWRKVTFTAKTHADVRLECVWMNFPAPQQLHDARYLGDTFRDRQTIARRQARLRARIGAMNPAERADFASWMAETYGSSQEGA